jgi:flavodoxin
MKTAIIYYSYEGNSALVAESIKAVLGADAFEIKTIDKKQRRGFAKYFWGCGQVVMHKKPAIEPLATDFSAYGLVVLGTPVWAGSPAPAMVSFLEKTKLSGKRIALFCCHGGGKRKAFERFRALLPGNDIAGEIDFLNAAKENPAVLKQKISEWVKGVNTP